MCNDRFAFNDANHRFTTVFGNIAVLRVQGSACEGVVICALNPERPDGGTR